MTRLTILTLVLLFALPVSAQVYKTTDDQGRTVYTDQKPKDREHEEVELGPLNTQPPMQARERTETDDAESETGEEVPNFQVALTSPADGAQIPPGQRDLPLIARVQPGLGSDYALQFMLDGSPYGPPTQASGTIVNEIYRGEHTVSVMVIDRDGTVLARSQPVTVYVFRPTLNSPARKH